MRLLRLGFKSYCDCGRNVQKVMSNGVELTQTHHNGEASQRFFKGNGWNYNVGPLSESWRMTSDNHENLSHEGS